MNPKQKPNAALQQTKVSQARSQVQQYMQAYNIAPEKMIQYGQLAESVLRDRALYPMFRQQAINDGIVDADDLPKQANPSVLAMFVTMGKLVSA
jgi:hypothetical protein